MKFGPVPVGEAAGSYLAHSLKVADAVWKKGRRLSADDLPALQAAGLAQVVVARLDASDVHEDEAARRLAEALAGTQALCGVATTGRANLLAGSAGLICVDALRIHAINAVHESLTVATLPPFELVAEGQMLATIQVIPYAVPRAALEQVLALSQGAAAAICVAGFRRITVGLILTTLPGTRTSVLTKMRESVQKRLHPLQAQLGAETTVAHEQTAVAEALARMTADPTLDVVLVSGIAATVDRADVVPAAIEQAGGRVVHAGMPVDPGNLLVLGNVARADSRCVVVGLPTCARSPKLNGFDFVLRRLAAGLDVSAHDLMAMGVGGLLTEIPLRPMPRESLPFV